MSKERKPRPKDAGKIWVAPRQYNFVAEVIATGKPIHILEAERKLGRFTAAGLCDPNTDNETTLMYWACFHGRLDVAKWLLQNDARPSMFVVDNKGNTPLMVAVIKGHLGVVRWICKTGASSTVVIKDRHGQSPIFCAAGLGMLDMCKLLHEYGANVSVKCRGHSPLAAARRYDMCSGDKSVVSWLQSVGAAD